MKTNYLRMFQLSLTLVASVFCVTTTARAATSACSGMGGIGLEKVTYIEFDSNDQDPRANPTTHHVRLRGWLYYNSAASSVKNAPVIIYNHGHNEDRNEPCAIAKFFVPLGFVVFAPLRRGHNADGLNSTGVHIDEYVSLCQRTESQAQSSGDKDHLFCNSVYCRQDVSCSNSQKDNAVEMYYLRSQHVDVQDQINYIKNRAAIGTSGKLANLDKIAILGHSFGGALIIFTNEFDYGQSVAIDISGGELSWGNGNPESEPNNPYWEIDLKDAMQSQKQPMYFLQPKNGRTLEPMQDLFKIAITRKYRSQASIFPNVPWITAEDCTPSMSCWDDDENAAKPEYQQAHEDFIGKLSQVKKWGPSVVEFIERYPR